MTTHDDGEGPVERRVRPLPLSKHFERNAIMFDALLHGATYQEAADKSGVTRERVRQIHHKMMRMMCHPWRLNGDTVPARAYSSVKDFRAAADFWVVQLKKWKAEYVAADRKA